MRHFMTRECDPSRLSGQSVLLILDPIYSSTKGICSRLFLTLADTQSDMCNSACNNAAPCISLTARHRRQHPLSLLQQEELRQQCLVHSQTACIKENTLNPDNPSRRPPAPTRLPVTLTSLPPPPSPSPCTSKLVSGRADF